MIPESYDAWRHCIVEECGIRLEENYIDRRLRTLKDDRHAEVRKFRARYGDTHWQRIISWFERAKRELAGQG